MTDYKGQTVEPIQEPSPIPFADIIQETDNMSSIMVDKLRRLKSFLFFDEAEANEPSEVRCMYDCAKRTASNVKSSLVLLDCIMKDLGI